MEKTKNSAISKWIKLMGFKLIRSYVKGKSRINYYSLGNFGIYEELTKADQSNPRARSIIRKFRSWNPWGIDFEVKSVSDLSRAYQDNLSYNPN